jgi:hypothetical protein
MAAEMSQESVAQLLEAVRESITRTESTPGLADHRALRRVLAYLWLAHDELESLSTART